ncbi:unnamed protein product [Pedinophyceae sp. YPF-701]|nr:unnamed protein product [Pedinophyceae sp. YPF-701]
MALRRALGTASQLPAHKLHTSCGARMPWRPEEEIYNRQRTQMVIGDRWPVVDADAWLAPNAVVVGDVDVHSGCSIWHGAVIRGDLSSVKLGANTVVGENTVIHAARSVPTGLSPATAIYGSTIIGRRCVLRSVRTRGRAVYIGDRSILMEGCILEGNNILAPGTVVPPGRLIPEGEVWAGNPARFVRKIRVEEIKAITRLAKDGERELARGVEEEFLPHSPAYIEAEKLKGRLHTSGVRDMTPHCTPPSPWYPFVDGKGSPDY